MLIDYGRNPQDKTTCGADVKTTRYNFLGGVQVKDNSSEATFKPFAHLRFGIAIVLH
jgi:hypothetical protein